MKSNWIRGAGLVFCTTTVLFAGTYFGLPYEAFWMLLAVQVAGLILIWPVSPGVALPVVVEPHKHVKFVGFRKQGAIESLLDASRACQRLDADFAKTLKMEIDKLQGELEFLPTHAVGVPANELMSELINLSQDIGFAVKTALMGEQAKALFDDLMLKIKITQRHVSYWK